MPKIFLNALEGKIGACFFVLLDQQQIDRQTDIYYFYYFYYLGDQKSYILQGFQAIYGDKNLVLWGQKPCG